ETNGIGTSNNKTNLVEMEKPGDLRSKSMRERFCVNWLVCAALMLVILPTLFGQTASTGALTGTVTDPQGAVVPNSTVTATNTGTGQTRSATTSSSGAYSISLLPPGQYTVKFEAGGFQKVEVPNITITVTETAVLDRAMSVGAQSQEVTVQGETEAI